MPRPDNFGTRLDRIALIVMPSGCDHCRGWSKHVLAYDDPITGEVVSDRPLDCPGCGRTVEILREIYLPGIGPDDL